MCGLCGVFSEEEKFINSAHKTNLLKFGSLAQPRGIDASGLIAPDHSQGINIVKANSGFRSLTNSAERRQLIKTSKRSTPYGMISRAEAISRLEEDNKLNILGLVSYFETARIDSSWVGDCIEPFAKKELAA